MIRNLIIITLLFLVINSHAFSQSNNAAGAAKVISLSQRQQPKHQRRKLQGKIPVQSRTIPIETAQIDCITIWELEKPKKLMDLWMSADLDSSSTVKKDKIGDPFGVVLWPGSILASRELAKFQSQVQGSTVLILGAGTGVEAQCAALLGAEKVIAIDISKLSLKLMKFGAEQAGVDDIVQGMHFDLFSEDELPECDVLVAADVLYNADLAQQIGRRCIEVMTRLTPPKLIITDSQRFHGTDFLQDVNDTLEARKGGSGSNACLEWDYYELKDFRGSGIMIDGDQTYDATTRMVSQGWQHSE